MSRTLLSALIGLLFAVAPVSAQWFDFGEQCSTGSMQTCASFQAMSSYDSGLDQTTLYFRVRNLYFLNGSGEIGGSILSQFGVLSPDLINPVTQSIYTEGNVGVVGSPGDNWAESNSANRLGDVSWALVAGSGGNSNSNGGILSCEDPDRTPGSPNLTEYYRTCDNDVPAGWVVFKLTSDGTVDMSNLKLAWGVTSDSFTGESWQGETIPEPMTVVLLGVGLLGVGVAARRRRNLEGIDD